MSIQRQKNGRVSIRRSNHIRQEYWSGLPIPSPGDLLNPRIKSMSPVSPAWWISWQVDSLPLSRMGSPHCGTEAPILHSWPLKNLNLNSQFYLYLFCFFFPVGNTTWSRFHNPGLVESACAKEPWIKRANCELPAGFPLCRKPVSLTHFVQGSTVLGDWNSGFSKS